MISFEQVHILNTACVLTAKCSAHKVSVYCFPPSKIRILLIVTGRSGRGCSQSFFPELYRTRGLRRALKLLSNDDFLSGSRHHRHFVHHNSAGGIKDYSHTIKFLRLNGVRVPTLA